MQDYGVDETPKPQKSLAGTKSKLHPRVASLMKMLFDLETYKYENESPPYMNSSTGYIILTR